MNAMETLRNRTMIEDDGRARLDQSRDLEHPYMQERDTLHASHCLRVVQPSWKSWKGSSERRWTGLNAKDQDTRYAGGTSVRESWIENIAERKNLPRSTSLQTISQKRTPFLVEKDRRCEMPSGATIQYLALLSCACLVSRRMINGHEGRNDTAFSQVFTTVLKRVTELH